MPDATSPRPTVAVGAVVLDGGRLLLIERGTPPAMGQWTVPGGRVEPGERLRDAVRREVFEETGLQVTVGRMLGWVERIDSSFHYVILDFECTLDGPSEPLRPGDDAAGAEWVPLESIGERPLTAGLVDFLTDVGVVVPGSLGADPVSGPSTPEGASR